jgi:hypothetical protein
VTLPSFTVPKVTLPSGTLPSGVTPAPFTLPSVTLPSITLPSITLPSITLPSVRPTPPIVLPGQPIELPYIPDSLPFLDETYWYGLSQRYDEKVPSDGLLACEECSDISNIRTLIAATQCTPPKGDKMVSKTLPVKVLWNRLASDPAFKSATEKSLLEDVAAALGVPTNGFSSYGLKEDITSMVSTSSRRMRVLENGAGSKFDFTLQASSNTITDSASTKFDKIVASGEPIPLPSTSNTILDKCGSDCTDKSSTSLAGGSYTVGGDNIRPLGSSGAASKLIYVALMLCAIFIAL